MLPTQIDLPSQIPVIALAGCNLLPHGLLPLYIFEPRYRQMLADALDGDRLFAVGTIDPACDPSAENPDVLEHSCAGLIRACVGAEDGTSNLVLQGMQRIRFTSWQNDRKPYRIANIEPIATADHDPEHSVTLAGRAVELARELISAGHPAPSSKALEEIEAIRDPEALADLIAYNLIRDPQRRQALLGMQDLGERLRFIIAQLASTGSNLP